MTETNFAADAFQQNDFKNEPLPTGLNVLTILTFIGCGIFGLLTLASPWVTKFMLSFMDKAASSGGEISEKQLADLEKSKAMMETMQVNMIPLMIVGMVGIALCFVGAFMMRKLKKDGFWLYVAGQVVPLAASVAIVGMAQYQSPSSFISLIFPIGFIIAYAMQRKYLVK